ncbi:TPA: class III signal peptide-containing protein [Candidatus Micrarchaeota archaeon]|nr:class III signal peptide-containing protein [Candidatus Micrarchaeota archaeon]
MDSRAQTSTEYLLILALSLVVLVIVLALAMSTRDLSEVLANRAAIERNETLQMLLD